MSHHLQCPIIKSSYQSVYLSQWLLFWLCLPIEKTIETTSENKYKKTEYSSYAAMLFNTVPYSRNDSSRKRPENAEIVVKLAFILHIFWIGQDSATLISNWIPVRCWVTGHFTSLSAEGSEVSSLAHTGNLSQCLCVRGYLLGDTEQCYQDRALSLSLEKLYCSGPSTSFKITAPWAHY